MYCVKCGTKAEKGQKLCHECGMRLITPEALLKLLKKADLEKKQKRMAEAELANRIKGKENDDFIKGYVDRLKEDEPKGNAVGKKTKTEKSKEKSFVKKEAKRVTPLFDNPTQPKRKSIFDNTPDEEIVKKKEPSAGLPEKTSRNLTKTNSNPVVKLPEKRKTATQGVIRTAQKTRTADQLFYVPKRKEARENPSMSGRGTAVKRTNASVSAIQRPDHKKGATSKTAVPVRTARDQQRRASTGGAGIKKARAKRDEESFVEKYLRSIISMMLLTCTVIMMLMWGYATDSGLRTMAEFGLGSRKGYILLGDDCMADGNYKRAVEHYYKALSKKVNYEAGIKLARAYRETGEAEKETSALLLLMDRYQGMEEPYQRILELFPDPSLRPDIVQNAINMHER